MKKIAYLFVFVALVALTCASCAAAAPLSVTIKNGTSKTISFAFAQVDASDENTHVIRGWFNVPTSFSGKTIKPFDFDPDCEYYWYAISGKKVWSGKDFYGYIRQGKAFKAINGKKLPSGKKVGFRPLKISESGKAVISFQP